MSKQPQQFLQNPFGRLVTVEEYVANGFNQPKAKLPIPAGDEKINGKTIEEINDEKQLARETRTPGENLNAPGQKEKEYKEKLERAKNIIDAVEDVSDAIVEETKVTTDKALENMGYSEDGPINTESTELVDGETATEGEVEIDEETRNQFTPEYLVTLLKKAGLKSARPDRSYEKLLAQAKSRNLL